MPTTRMSSATIMEVCAMTKPSRDVLSILTETDSHRERDTLVIAFGQMDEAERADWQAVIECRVLNPKSGRQFAIDHIAKAMKVAGWQVSPAAVQKWRRNTQA